MSRLALSAWLYVLVLLLALLLERFVAERFFPTLLLTYAPQHLFLVLAVGLCLWTFVRRDIAAVLPALMATGLGLSLLGWTWPLPAPPPASGHTFRVMTYNVARGSRATPAALARFIRSVQPDVVCLQEVNGVQGSFLQRLAEGMPGYTLLPSREVAILTRLPVKSSRVHVLPGTGRAFLEAHLTLNGQELTVTDVHFSAVQLTGDVAATRQRRSEQVVRLLALARAASTPFVACGDFNTPPRGLVYRALQANFTSAFAAAGKGLGQTFPSSFPLLRIDHLLLRGGVVAQRAWVPKVTLSDHRPLVADLALAPRP